MSKHFLEDMVIDKRKRQGTEEITLKRKESKEPQQNLLKKIRENEYEYRSNEITKTYSPKKSKYLLWFVALVSITFCFFAISFLFSKAEILITPKSEEVVLNENLSAVRDANDGGVSFDLVVFSGQENKSVGVTGEKDVSIPATGTAIIYNAFSAAAQTLAIDTRLEGSNGKIYKTETRVIVPGKSKTGTPGSTEVKIYGSLAGDAYNSDPLDFKILGFKGTSKYNTFYGRSKGPIAGGFVGKVPDITDAEKTTVINNLKTTLQADLSQKAIDQMPHGFVLFKNATFFNIDDANAESAIKDGKAIITLKGTLYGLLFDEQKLTKKIAGDMIKNHDQSDVYIPSIKNLNFSLSAGQADIFNKDNTSLDSVQNISFNLSGPAKIVSRVDVEKFTTDLLGKSKKDFNQILAQYGSIDSALLTLNPIWKMSLPNKAKDIKVIVNYPI